METVLPTQFVRPSRLSDSARDLCSTSKVRSMPSLSRKLFVLWFTVSFVEVSDLSFIQPQWAAIFLFPVPL